MTSGFSFELLSEDRIKASLGSSSLVDRIYAFWTVSSTNDFAYKRALHDDNEGTLVVAEEQTRGRGRKARVWDSQFNLGLWFSLILRPEISASKAGLLPFLASVSVAEALEGFLNLKPDLKWPNDALLSNRKFCGILSEAEFIDGHVKFIILGIGINVNHKSENLPEDIRGQSTSVRIQSQMRVDRADLLAAILKGFESNYTTFKSNGILPILEKWKARCSRLGKSVEVVQDDGQWEGIFQDIDAEGRMLLQLKSGEIKKIVAADVLF